MNKLHIAVAAVTVGTCITLCLSGTALAWHPQGKIIKSVQDVTSSSQTSNASSESGALSVAPGDTLQYTVTVSNAAASAANHDNDMAYTVMTDTLPTGVELASNPAERVITENIGTILPGKSVTKQYEVKVTSTTDGTVITNKACFTGNSIVKDNPQSGCATVVVKVHIPAVPAYTCNLLSVTQDNNRTVTISKLDVTATNGATFKNAVIDWGDTSTPLVTASADNQTHQYAADGTYKVAVAAHFSVNGEDKSVSSSSCAATASFTAPQAPTQLPNTGAGGIVGPAVLAAAVGYVLYALNLKRRTLARR